MEEKTLMEICPNPTGGIRLWETNLGNPKSQLIFKLNGVKYTLSPKLTADVRSQKVKWDELGDYMVREVTGDDGKPFLSLGYPGENITINLSWKHNGKTTTKVLTVNEFYQEPGTVLAFEELG